MATQKQSTPIMHRGVIRMGISPQKPSAVQSQVAPVLRVRVLPSWSRNRYTKSRHKKGLAFTANKPYHVFGFDHDDAGVGYVILCNEYKELWWVNNRHVRVI